MTKNYNLKTRLALVVACCLFVFGMQAQTNIANYKFATSTGTYTPITGGTVVASGAYDNQVSALVPLGGTFNYGGVAFTGCFISANGYITFGAAPAGTAYTPMSTLGTTTAAISAFGQDAGGSTAAGAVPEVSYLNIGGATGEFVVQYKDHANYYNSSTERLNFQIRLNLSTGDINIIYGTCTNPGTVSTSGTTPQVGIRGNSTTWTSNVNDLMVGNVPAGTTCNWSNAVTGNANSSTMLFSGTTNVNVNIPAGLTYTWMPATAVAPVRTFAAVSAIGSTSATINWTAPTGATQYNIMYRALGSCGWTLFAGSPVATPTATLTGLTPSTVYQTIVQASDGTNNAIYSHIPNQAGTGNGYVAAGTFTTLAPACAGTPTAGTITGAASVCSGLGTTLTLTGATAGTGISYQWASSTTTGGPYTNAGTALTQATGALSATTYYVVTTTCSASGLSSTTPEFTVTVNPLPTVSVLPTSGSLCQPGAVAIPLTASGANTYTWGPSAGLSGTTGTTVNALPTATTTYTVTGTDLNGCVGTATAAITVSEVPSIFSPTATPSSVCSGANSQLLANAATTATYAVTSIPFAPIATPGVGVTTLCNGGVATTTLSSGSLDDGGWMNQGIPFNFRYFGVTYTSFAVSTNGFVALGAGAPTTYTGYNTAFPSTTPAHPALGPVYSDLDFRTIGTINYFVSGTAPNRKLVVNWSNGNFFNAVGAINAQMIISETSNSIEMHVTNSTGTNAAVEGIQNAPGTTAYTVTGRNNTNWTVSTSDGYRFAPSGGTITYAWSPATFLSSTIINNPMANGITATTTYTVTASNNGCSSNASVTITAGAPLTSSASVTPSATFCQGATINLNATPVGGGAPYTYAWTGPNSFTSTSQNPVITGATVLATGTYTVTVTDNCSSTSVTTVSLTVNANPSVSVTPTTATYCNPGTAVALAASGASTYTWLPAAGLSPTTGANVNASPSATTTYTVSGTDGNGCIGTATAAITVSEVPSISPPTATPSSVCSGANSQLLANAATTATYAVTSIPFAPIATPGVGVTTLCNGGVATTTLSSGSLDDGGWMNQGIPFNFQYFGVTYTSFAVSTNGFVALGAGAPTTYTGYNTAFPSTTPAHPALGPVYSDLDFRTIGTINYFVSGTAPNRKLVVNWSNGNFYNGVGAINAQMIISETSNSIEMHVTNSTGTNAAVEGIQNAPGTTAYTVTGRNNTNWTVSTSDGYRFAPSGGTITYAWSPATFLSSTIINNPMANGITATTTYTVTASNNGCSSNASVTITAGAPLTSSASVTPSATFCQGATINLNATPVGGGAPYTYAWTGPNSFTSTSQNPVITGATVLATGTYTVTVTDNCSVTSVTTVTLTVNANPTVGVTPTSGLYCSPGASVALTASGATGFTWAPASGLSGTVGSTVSASPAATTTYTVIGTDGNGCTGSATTVISSGVNPTVTFTATPSTICSGGNSVLNAVATLPAPIYCTPTYTNGTGFGDYATSVILNTLNNTTGASASPYYTLYPASGSTTTTLIAGNTYTITLSAGTYTDNDMAAWIDYNQNGTLNNAGEKLGETDGMGAGPATTSFTFTVPVGALNGTTRLRVREMDHGTTNDMDPCAPQSTFGEVEDYIITISGGVNQFTYAWSPSTFLSATTGSTVNANAATATTTYNVIATTLVGCNATFNSTLTVNPLPTVSVMAMPASVCTGGSTTLMGMGASTYAWSGGITDNVSFSPVATATYTVTGTDLNGCVNTAMQTVTVNPLPTVTANSTAVAICDGGSVTLTGGGATSYTWDNGVTNAVAFNPIATTTYMVTGTDGNGCMNTATTTVTVNPLPTVVANSTASTICNGDPVTLTGSGAVSYTWDNGVMDGVAFNPSATTTYNVTGTDGNGCMNSVSTTVTVNALPTVVANSDAAGAVCTGTMVTLTGSGATSYTWDNGVMDAVAFASTTTTTYMVTGTDGNGCMNTDMITVTVNPLPTVTANSTAAAICMGGAVTLTGGGATSYTWDNSVMDGVAFNPTSTVTYNVTGTDANGCMNTANTTVTVNALPTVVANTTYTAICAGSSVTLSGSGALSYAWDNSVMDGVAFNPAATNTYMVTGTDGNGCMNMDMITVTVNALPTVTFTPFGSSICDNGGPVVLTGGSPAGGTYTGTAVSGGMFDPAISGMGTYQLTYSYSDVNSCSNTDTTSITVDLCSGIASNNFNIDQLTVYPNPTSGSFNIAVSNANFTELQINIVDIQGKQVYSSIEKNIASEFSTQINLEGLAKGIYYIKLSTGSDMTIQKLIVQ